MKKILILGVGKNKETWLEAGLEDYRKRLKGKISIEERWVKDDAALRQGLQKERLVLCLSPEGKLLNSEEFSSLMQEKFLEGGSRLCFAIGGADGLPSDIRKAYQKISLSPLTFTHQITRLVLYEQIYRADQIASGSPYHRA